MIRCFHESNDFDFFEKILRKINTKNIKQILNSTNSGSQTLLHRACRNGNPKIVKLLLDNGAIARPHYYTKYSPLYIACHMGNIEIARMILDVSNVNYQGLISLHKPIVISFYLKSKILNKFFRTV